MDILRRWQMPLVALTLLTVLSGFYVRFSESWSLLYKCNLFLHPLVGVVWGFGIYRAIRQRRAGSGAGKQGLGPGILLVLAIGVIASSLSKDLFFFWGAVVLSLLPVLATVLRRGKGFRSLTGNHAFPSLFLFAVLLVSASGVLIFSMRLGQELRPVFAIHGAAGSLSLLLLAVLFLYGWWKNPAAIGDLFATKIGIGKVEKGPELGLLVVAGLTGVALWAADGKPEEVTYTFHLSTVPLERRKPHEVDEIPKDFTYATVMTAVDSCGGARGCHQGIVDDHHRSSHNRSIQTSYFQRNLEFLAEEIGDQNTYICAGCHFPNAYFIQGTGFRDYEDRDGWSCLYCHTVDDVVFTKEKGKTILKLRPNVNHVKMFAPPATGKGLRFINEMMIQLNPRGHGRAFTRDLYFQDQYCQVCHNLQIKPSENPGFMKANCIDCHMQGRKWMGKEGKERNHFFPGTNLAGPADLGDEDAMRINTMYSRGEMELALRGWGGIWSLVPKEDRKIKDIWLQVNIEPLVDPVPGNPLAYRVVTTNTSLDHAFPAAPLDLIEVWLETQVKDARGRVLFQSGVLDEAYKIPEGAHKLGGYMIGMDNHLVTKNRVWQIKKKVIEREILVNEQIQDRYTFSIPEDAVGPLEIYASWNYRKLNQEFVDWAYNNDGTTVPLLRIAEMTQRVHLSDSRDVLVQR